MLGAVHIVRYLRLEIERSLVARVWLLKASAMLLPEVLQGAGPLVS